MKLDLSKFSVQELDEMLEERKRELGILTLNPRMAEIVDEIEQIQFFMNSIKEPTDGKA
jgi:ribosomal protein L29